MSQIIAMWSGPRNLSTAMMRSFGARADCAVMDEPFFAPYLLESGKDHPGRAETLKRHETDPIKVDKFCQFPETDKPYCFQKHMPHHMLAGFPMGWAEKAKHFFLIREPERVIASYARGRSAFDLEDLGFRAQRSLFDELTKLTGHIPPVIASLDILKAPKKALYSLCGVLEIPFDDAMLQWESGGRAEDGAWAPYWYNSVRNSTTFTFPNLKPVELGLEYKQLNAACKVDFDYLSQYKLAV